ncbi:inorganic pyrophosphatase [Fulvivirga sediminis]|uniref:inorganic diphosphatase n=1 Tax=Fulvivirga sediminis TaxID=2803949 RepID=A0A937JZF1_9BACT|nr:inorganic pyrophosphatase [Fulvivirga sediminis]MBL3655225.1 inorganic pyrophosphatase [Fulvivirga sediminis]
MSDSIKPYMSHPWHGISAGTQSPEILNAFIEMTPADSVKYEIDKESGFLKVDRPQKFSNIVPALYGFVPQTYCAENVASLCMRATQKTDIIGDGDPLDICVLTERTILQGNILVPAIPIGGFRMIDGGEADDKIIAILKGDEVFQNWHSLEDCPDSLINRLKHYFLTYKQMPGEEGHETEIAEIYGKEKAYEVIRASQMDYDLHYKGEKLVTK